MRLTRTRLFAGILLAGTSLAAALPSIALVSPTPVVGPTNPGVFFTGTFVISGEEFLGGVVTTDGPLNLTGSPTVNSTGTTISQGYSIGCCAPQQGQTFHLIVTTPNGSASITDTITLAATNCINFPAGLIPFSSVSYVSAANSAGDHLVVGVPAPGALSLINASISLPTSTNQTFCDSQVQLAPQQFYPSVYVATALELSGNFSAFAGLLVNAANGQPYPNGVIPAGQLANVFAWRIGPAQVTPAVNGWSPTGSMSYARALFGAVLLPSGKVFAAGGCASCTAELFDPATGTFTLVGPPSAQVFKTVTLLKDGRVLILAALSDTEIYDPVSGQFSTLPATVEQTQFTATLLNDGRVLVVGGMGAEVFDPVAGTFAAAGPMSQNRTGHTATLLPDGRVLVAGGYPFGQLNIPLSSAEIFDPSQGTFSPTGSMHAPRYGNYAALLPSGMVLVGGGDEGPATAELFDPTSGTFALTGTPTAGSRISATATLLSNGQVLVAGGVLAGVSLPACLTCSAAATASSELYIPTAASFTPAGNMTATRGNAASTLLPDGRVLTTGGQSASGGSLSSAELFTPVAQGLVTSQTGLTFRIAQGSATPPPQTVAVLSNTATIPWSLSTHTYQGGSWLSVTPTSGSSVPGATPVTLTITANPTGLAAQDYYGAVILTPTDGTHPPITIAIVLHIVPAGTAAPPAVTPSGLLFLGTPGATLKSQAFTISNLTSAALAFNTVASGTPNWFAFTPQTGTINAAQTISITITATLGSMAAGVYPASIKLLFGDGSTQTVALLLVISATAGSAGVTTNETPEPFAITPEAAAACTATKLLPVFTAIGTGFNTSAAWPTALVVQVVDDCGVAINTGSVIVSFSDGDPPIGLLSTGNGNWAGTWVPVHNTTGFTVRADAQRLPLTGSVQVSGQVLSNPTVPVVATGGIVSNGDFAGAPAVGLLVSIFGSGLADGSAQFTNVPLPQRLGSTSVVLSGVELPQLYVSDTQVNVAIPYNVPVNTSQQLVVLRGNAVSVPVPLAVFASEPSILSVSGRGSGQGLIFNAITGMRADTNSPAAAGDYLVIYALGLGAVTPPIAVEDGAPPSPYEYAVAPVTVTVGGVPATVLFAGMTPGYVGLYQVNVAMPGGVTPGSQVPVTVSVAGKSGAGAITIAVH